MLTSQDELRETGLTGVALKPTEVDVSGITELPLSTAVLDFEGIDHLPTRSTLERLADRVDLRVTVPVRADGFDPLGDDSAFDRIPAGVDHVLVAGNPAYLGTEERRRPIAPRFGAALDRANDPWVGTESVERLALATGVGQFELLGPTTERDFRGLREAGFDGHLAVYAPTVVSPDDAVVLDAVGDYLARRDPVREQLPREARTDRRAAGPIRETLLNAAAEYVIAGGASEIQARVDTLLDAGADSVIAYPAEGLERFGVRS